MDIIDKSLDEAIQSDDEDSILRRIRENYLADSTVTIHLIGLYGAEDRGVYEQRFIKCELQASLYNSQANPRNAILGVVLPARYDDVYKGSYTCGTCGGQHFYVGMNDHTTVREFWRNYYIDNGNCSHTEDERYCVLASWQDFTAAPNEHIDAGLRQANAANRKQGDGLREVAVARLARHQASARSCALRSRCSELSAFAWAA